MANVFSKRGCNPHVRYAGWLKMVVAGCFALSGALAHAGVLSVTTGEASGQVTFNIFDNSPADMCVGEVCFADFAVDFNPAELEFLENATASPHMAMAHAEPGGPKGSQVLVSFVADPDQLASANLLFSLSFRSLVTQQVTLTIGPRDFGGDEQGDYQHQAIDVSLPVATAVPEPSTALLAALGLGALAWRRRKQPVPQQTGVLSA